MWQKQFLLLFVLGAFLSISLIPAVSAEPLERSVMAGADDAYEIDGKMVVNGLIVPAGKDGNTTLRGGYRFTDVKIPKGAVITKAALTLAYNWRSGPADTVIYGEASDNAAAFSAAGSDISSRAKTSASTAWTAMPEAAWGTRFESPDISGVIQEVVNRNGWSSGNSLAVLQYESPNTVDSWESVPYEEDGPRYSAKLNVEYNVPGVEPAPKVIIFRDDDAQPWWRLNTFKNITNTLINNGIPQTIGVIPGVDGGMISSDPKFKAYLNSIKNNAKVELALHGYAHTPNEFASLSLAEAQGKMIRGITIFSIDLGITPVTFIPPYHAYNDATLDAAKNAGLTRFSTGAYNDRYPWQEKPAGLLHVPSVSDFYNWDEGRYRTADEITGDCQKSLDKSNACVILFHYSMFTDTSSVVVDPARYKVLLDVIGWAKNKEAGGAKLMTIKDYGK